MLGRMDSIAVREKERMIGIINDNTLLYIYEYINETVKE